MTYTAEQIAEVCHEANRALQRIHDRLGVPGIPVATHWAAFPEPERQGVIAGVRLAMDGASPERLHNEWCDGKLRDGWRHGTVKDTAAKTHPCLVPYDELPLAQRHKDALFAAIVAALAPPAAQPVTLADIAEAALAPYTGQVTRTTPRLGDVVHYVSYGTPGSEYESVCRAAIVTEASEVNAVAKVCVLNPTGVFFSNWLDQDQGTYSAGEREVKAGESLPAITCADLDFGGGTWHLPHGS